MKKPQFDIILFGATSFVGRLVATHLHQLVAQNSTALPDNFTWAMAARNLSAMQLLRDDLGAADHALPLIGVDANNESQLRDMCALGRVIVSTVGPYALYGEALVQVCAELGTDYCDLTGEVPWIRRMLDRYEKLAQQSGAHIVHCCGFDSIPSDLGVFYIQQLAKARFGHPLDQVKMGVVEMKGGISGGTVASMINVAKETMADKALRKQLADPYLLCPRDHRFKARQPSERSQFDTDFDRWTSLFLMAGINTRIVHRSNALLRHDYGDNFRYSEVQLLGKHGRWRSALTKFGLVLFLLLLALPPTRWLLQTFVLPKPGQGPSPEQQRKGLFNCIFIGKNNNTEMLRTRVTGDMDPGYGSTAKMLTQAALCIAFDTGPQTPGGFYTPAALMGNPLLARLNKYAGVSFSETKD